MDAAAILAVGSFLASLATIIGAVVAIRHERKRGAAEQRKVQALEDLAKSQTVIAGSLEREVKELRTQALATSEAAKNLQGEIETLRREWKDAVQQTQTRKQQEQQRQQVALVKAQAAAQARVQQLEQRQREAEWARSRDLAKALGWVLERMD